MQIQTGDISEIWGKKKLVNLFAPIENSTIVLFRIMFGGIMFWEVTRYFDHDWINRYWVEPRFNFSYAPFHFQPLSADAMHAIWYMLGALAIFITIGFLYRISTVLFFLLFSYTYLLEQARYLNHFYLVIMVSLIMIFIPANRAFSIDARLFKNIRSNYNQAWNLWLIRFTIGVPYFFGGIAKINADWLRGYPLHNWLLGDLDFPIIGKYFTEDWMIMIMSYSGLLLDLLVVPILLFKKTRPLGFVVICLFHLMNTQLFEIGIFPWFMIAATSLFFAPDWPKKLFSIGRSSKTVKEFKAEIPDFKAHKWVLVPLVLFMAIQVFLPLRHLLIPGLVHWTEEGHKYAWHMKLRSKSGRTLFLVRNKQTGEVIEIEPDRYIEDWQEDSMDGNPGMIWLLAQHIKSEHNKMGIEVEVYAEAKASLNGRKYQNLIDPNVDLTKVKRSYFGHSEWILPLTVSLEDQR
jgi:vitamin K-dependent gamma-carboxylase